MVILKEITLNNFKSFKGEIKVGNVLPFTAIVGCNGAGKSNFMDAISFVMGVNTNNLRVSRMEELLYKSRLQEYQHEMSVTAVLKSSDGVEMSFERSFRKSSCQYLINLNVVSHNDYVEALKKLGINSRIKNFLVFQNSIESIVTKTPMQRTAMFEDISGSGSLASEYKRLKSELMQLEEEVKYLQQNKRSISAEIKKLLYYKAQAHEYAALEKKHENAQVKLTLFNIYHIERLISYWSQTVEDINAKILELETEKYQVGLELKAAAKACKKLNTESTRIEWEINEMKMKSSKKQNAFLNIEANIQYARGRVVSCETSLESAIKAEEARNETIKQLEDALKAVELKKNEYLQRFSTTLGRDLQPRESQFEEYERLKALCSERFINDHEELMILEREHKSIVDELETAMRRKDEKQRLIKENSVIRLELLKRTEKLEKFIEETKNELERKSQYQGQLIASLQLSKEKERACTEELEDIRQQIGDFKYNERIKEKNEIVDYLKRIYPGVFDRLRNICNPNHNRYRVAVTKVIGRHLDSIIVDTSKTARLCVEYLKLQQIGTETFLPLDNLEVEPLNHRLREMKNPPNVKLVYDVITFDPKISRVIQFVTRNTLVCEIPEHAAEIACGAQKNNCHDCVSVDGTLHRKSGLMSGGARDLLTKAQRWDSSLKMKLLSRKDELITELREIRRGLPKESEISTISSTIVNLQERLKYANIDLQAVSARFTEIEFKIQDSENDLDETVAMYEEIESRMSESTKMIEQLKLKINEEEHEFFADFCRNIGVDDIRHFEDGQKFYKEAIQNFDCQIDRINEQLDFERGRNTENNISRWEMNLRNAKLELASQLEEKQNKLIPIIEEKKRLNDYEMQYKNIKKTSEEASKKLIELQRKIDVISKEHSTLSKQVNGLQTLIEKNKARRYTILTEAKVRGLRIPSINDPPDDSSVSSDALDQSCWMEESMENRELESNIKYDFSMLPSDLTTLEDNLEIRRMRENLENNVAEIANAIEALADPNMKASQQVAMLKDKLREITNRFDEKRKDSNNAKREFELLKNDRRDRFMRFFEHTAEQVDVIYKKLTRSPTAQAYLLLENPEEPYLAGTQYHCVVPGKRFQTTNTLSGGEKTVAALPLVFAAHGRDNPSFKVLDEIDASLDNENTTKVMKYIDENKDVQQAIVISHKEEFFSGADALIGIDSVTTGDGTESRILTFDLRCYQR